MQFQLSRIRVPAGFVLGVLYFFFSRPTWTSLAVGLSVALVGLMMRAWAAGYLSKNRRLATGGPFALTRNPLYFGTFLIGSGFSIAGRTLVFLIVFLAGFGAIYGSTVRQEAKHLQVMFPDDYAQYRERVPLFFPHLGPVERGDHRFSMEQYWKNHEYRALLGFLVAVIVLVLKVYYS